jgi:HSP20 family protein
MYLTFKRISPARTIGPVVNGAAAFDPLFDGIFYPAPSRAAATGSTVAARFDVIEKADAFEARIEIPGVGKDDIDVQIDGASVRVKAEVKTVDAEGAKVLHSNRVTRSFQRNFTLPAEVDDARAEAAYQDGVLTLNLPKKEVPQPKRLTIK